MEYHEVRIVAELRKQGEHDRAEECSGARPCAVPPVASPSTWCPWLDRVEARWRAIQGTLGVNQDALPREGRL